jgi:geranylgeranyl pyrophosphate synthase
VGSDSKNKKSTYADIFGVEKAKNKYIMMYNECIDVLDSVKNAEFLIEMIKNISNREK